MNNETLKRFLAGESIQQIAESRGVIVAGITIQIMRSSFALTPYLPIGRAWQGGAREVSLFREDYIRVIERQEAGEWGLEAFWWSLSTRVKNGLWANVLPKQIREYVKSKGERFFLPSPQDIGKIKALSIYEIAKWQNFGLKSEEELASKMLRYGIVGPEERGWWTGVPRTRR